VLKLISSFLFIIFLTQTSYALTLNEIKKAIKDKGAKWQAGHTWVWDMPGIDQMMMMGETPQLVREFSFYSKGTRRVIKGLPTFLNWADKDGSNYMSPVTNQGKCGSCVAFAAIATLEGQVNVSNKWSALDMNFAEQHIWACGDGTCDRGWLLGSAARYLKSNGVPDEACFPYTSGASGQDLACSATCSDSRDRLLKINDYKTVSGWFSSNDEVVKALQNGPLMGKMTVYEDFLTYTSGVYEYTTGSALGGHAITIVGYDSTQKYWIVKNSWGTEWGDRGYFKIKWDDRSGVGPGSYQFIVDPFDGASKIIEPDYKEVISGVYSVKMESTYKNTVEMKLDIKDGERVKTINAKQNPDGSFTAELDTRSLTDGVYQSRAVAVVRSTDNEEKERFSQIKRLYVLNGAPSISVKMNSPADGATLTDRVYIDFSVSSSPIPLEKLVFMIKNSQGQIKKVANNDPAPNTQIGWRTYLTANGDYEIWGEGVIGRFKTRTPSIRVTVKN